MRKFVEIQRSVPCSDLLEDADIHELQEYVEAELQAAGLDRQFDIVVQPTSNQNLPQLEPGFVAVWEAVLRAFDRAEDPFTSDYEV